MTGYTRQSSFQSEDTIEASHHNDEYNQLVQAFDESTGHAHDGTDNEGPVIGLIGDPGNTTPKNKVVVDNSNNRVGIFVNVGGSTVEQLRVQDGALLPVTDDDIDLGSSSLQFKDAYIDGTLNTDALALNTGSTVTAILDQDDMASNSDASLATQQSIKAYVDSQTTGDNSLSETLANGNTTGGTDLVVSSGDVLTTNTINETTGGSGVAFGSSIDVTSGDILVGGTLRIDSSGFGNFDSLKVLGWDVITSGLDATFDTLSIFDGATPVEIIDNSRNATFNTVSGDGSSLTSLDASNLASGTVPDARISESSVTQHEGAITITESQISDLGTYFNTAGSGLSSSGNTVSVDINSETSVGTLNSSDELLISDADDSNNIKKTTAQDIADLGGGGGAWVQIGSTVNASGASAIDFTSGIDGTYKQYVIMLRNITPGTDDEDLVLRLGSGSFDSGASDYIANLFQEDGGAFFSTSGDAIRFTNNGVDTSDGLGVSGEIHIFMPADASIKTTARSDVFYSSSTENPGGCRVSGYRDAAQADDRLRLLFENGTISGEATLYGLSN